MRYNFWLIYDFLKEYQPVIDTYHSDKSSISGVRVHESGQQTKAGYLYLAYWEDFCKLPKQESDNSTWIVLLSSEIKENEIDNESCLMHINGKCTILEVFSLLQERLEEYSLWYQRVLESLLVKNGVSKALRIAAEMLENPIALFDSAANLVDWCGDFRGNWKNTIWKDVIELGYAPADFYTLQEYRELTGRMINEKRPVLLQAVRDPEHHLLSAGIIINYELVGSFGLVDINKPFTQGQIFILSQIRDMFQIAYSNSKDIQNLSKSAAFYFEKLIRGEKVDSNQLREYLKHIGWKKNDVYFIVYFSFENKTDGERLYFLDKLRNFFRKAIFCNREQETVLLVKREESSWKEEEWRQEFLAFLKKRHARAVFSSEFIKIEEFKIYFEQCRAVDQLLKSSKESGIFFYPDLFQYDFLEKILENGDVANFCHPLLHALDLENGQEREQIQDLYAFLISGGNLSKAAKIRLVHRNSFIYRIKKIGEYLNMDLESLTPSCALYLILSCMILLKNEFVISDEK